MTIRFKLTTSVIAVILVANSLLSFIIIQYLGIVWMDEVQKRVGRNLNAARAAYRTQMELISTFLQGKATEQALAEAARWNDRKELTAILHELDSQTKIDFVALLDPAGKVICRTRNQNHGDDLASDPLVAEVLRKPRSVTGTILLSRKRLLREGKDLAERARFELVPTLEARPTKDRVRTEGMAVAAAVPVLDTQGRLLAILYGGNLLNRQYKMVDAIKKEVFAKEVYHGKDIGTVTIFQGDLRISTNVTMADGARAVGTRLSGSVCEAVLDRGEIWSKPAWVVNDWYITAYEPIRDPTQKIIGALYVGLLRAPFASQRNVISVVFLAIAGGTTLISLALLYWATGWVLHPVSKVVDMAQKVIGGDLTARTGIQSPGEMGILCRAIDSMAQAVAEREQMIQQVAREQISRSEHLASVGRLAAGVAHEINNPLTGVLAFADLMRQKENLDEEDKQDLDLIIRETKRVRTIVRDLLDFARETPSVKTRLNVNDVIRQATRLLGKRDAFQNITIVEDLKDHLPPVHGDKNQLQQVLVNLVLNACEAMPSGGTLTVRSAATADQVIVKVQDTGCGIKREHREQIFEPFYTTKPVGKGTGLGLSVSYGIVQQHGGTLSVESAENMGSTFTITLPRAEDSPAE
ncbi:MAG: cache domain-containing protein [Pirellulales bacterium]|nr:cache domain-containing protein [Pirellulales bacterium]